MKSSFFLVIFFLVSCSAVEASSSWITNLLNLNNTNFVVDNSGVITMDGFTYTIAEVRTSFSAIYNVFVGEFGNREANSIGFVRFDINPEALSDPRILRPLSVSEIAPSVAAATTAPTIGSSQITTVPEFVLVARFLRSIENLTYRELLTNGPSAGWEIGIVTDTEALINYIQGVVTTDGYDIFFQEVATRNNGLNTIFNGFYQTAHWKFVSPRNDTQGVYQLVEIEKFVPDSPFYENDDPDYPFPQASAADPVLKDIYVGVEKRSDGLYFYYPSESTFYTSAESVDFLSGIAVRVARQLRMDEIESL
ncbi:MAG: hypothetical protein ACRC9L_05035 [Brevinema sp.]